MTVDRHGLRPRDDKMVGKRNDQRLNPMPLFTLHPSIFNLPSLLLETDTEAEGEVAGARGGVVWLGDERTHSHVGSA
jgi:hypothetical protein